MHTIYFNIKGGVGKSTLCEYSAQQLIRNGHDVSVANTDQQVHVTLIESDTATYFNYDTAGAFTQDNIDLLQAIAADSSLVARIIVPIGIGDNDMLEVDFLIENFVLYGVMNRVSFVFVKTNKRSVAMREVRAELVARGIHVLNYVMPTLDAFARKKTTKRTIAEMDEYLAEIAL